MRYNPETNLPYSWRERIEAAKVEGFFDVEDREDASDWSMCAAGEKMDILDMGGVSPLGVAYDVGLMPRRVYTESLAAYDGPVPLATAMTTVLGNLFDTAVNNDEIMTAKQINALIEGFAPQALKELTVRVEANG